MTENKELWAKENALNLALARISEGKPVVTKHGFLDMQVCVPADWTDEQVIAFAEGAYPSGTTGGWSIRKAGSEFLAGAPERVECSGESGRPGFVHIMLDA